jgi:YD repeat-containing protein
LKHLEHCAWPYDADQEETSVTDPNGNTTQFTYDLLGRVQSETLPTTFVGSGGGGNGLATYTYGYDLNGNLLTSKDPNNHTTSNAYNALDEETSVTNADSRGSGQVPS